MTRLLTNRPTWNWEYPDRSWRISFFSQQSIISLSNLFYNAMAVGWKRAKHLAQNWQEINEKKYERPRFWGKNYSHNVRVWHDFSFSVHFLLRKWSRNLNLKNRWENELWNPATSQVHVYHNYTMKNTTYRQSSFARDDEEKKLNNPQKFFKKCQVCRQSK